MIEYSSIYSAVISILSAVITGGFVLVFVEIGNRKNRENDRYRQLMQPFMQKLSAYCRYMSWNVSHIQYPKNEEKTEHEQNFYNQTHYFDRMGGQLIVSGGNYSAEDFTASKLQKICEQINDVWYQYSNMSTKRLTWGDYYLFTENIRKEIEILNPLWHSMPDGIDKIVKISGDFYTDIYRPLEEDTFRHELLMKIYKGHSIFVLSALFVVLLSLCLMLCVSFSTLWLRLLTILVVCLFGVSLFFIFIDEKMQLRWFVKIRNHMSEIFNCNMKIRIKRWLEPIGLALLIGAFIWQNYSYYHASVARDEQFDRIEESVVSLLGCACDEAMKDSSRCRGNTYIYKNYDAVLSFQNECYANREWRRTEKNKADNSWLIQCVLYVIGSALVIAGKWPEKQLEK